MIKYFYVLLVGVGIVYGMEHDTKETVVKALPEFADIAGLKSALDKANGTKEILIASAKLTNRCQIDIKFFKRDQRKKLFQEYCHSMSDDIDGLVQGFRSDVVTIMRDTANLLKNAVDNDECGGLDVWEKIVGPLKNSSVDAEKLKEIRLQEIVEIYKRIDEFEKAHFGTE